jgi:hypothetical protein
VGRRRRGGEEEGGWRRRRSEKRTRRRRRKRREVERVKRRRRRSEDEEDNKEEGGGSGETVLRRSARFMRTTPQRRGRPMRATASAQPSAPTSSESSLEQARRGRAPDIVKDVRGSESNCEQDSREM